MLSWTLLQVHNHAVMDAFFTGVRASIAAGTFDADAEAFHAAYEAELPNGEAEVRGGGPRVRGYEVKSGMGQKRINERAYNRFEDVVVQDEGEGVVDPGTDAGELEEHGMGEKN
jgi:queuine tRNA-ribosyltransferase subunit QTRTD1